MSRAAVRPSAPDEKIRQGEQKMERETERERKREERELVRIKKRLEKTVPRASRPGRKQAM